MAYTTVNKSTDYFNIKLYTGNGSAGHAITGVGFAPDWTWIKNKGASAHHTVFDRVRGATKAIYTNQTDAETTVSGHITAFGSDGFTLGDNSGKGSTNENGATYVAWNWRAAGSTGSANSNGTISSTVSANTTAGFSIVSYAGNSTAGATVGHGLSSAPTWIIGKNRTDADSWFMYHGSLGGGSTMSFNNSNAKDNNTAFWNNTSPSNTVFTLGNSTDANETGKNYIAYCFTEVPGYSKFGSYKGNGYADGTFVYTGFKPAFVILKRTDAGSSNWQLNDTARDNVNIAKKRLSPSTSDPEYTNLDMGDILSNGFKIKQTDQTWNNSSGTYIYMAFGQSLVGSNNIPATAR